MKVEQRRPRIAILMAVRNRVESTRQCMAALTSQLGPIADASFYIVDDGSTDGTLELLTSSYPESTVIRGDGSLYWVGSMRLAESKALEHPGDYLLWINDDAELREGALSDLLDVAQSYERRAVVCTSMQSKQGGETTYSGVRVRRSPLGIPFSLARVEPADHPQVVDSFNGNLVLIPRTVVDAIGGIDPKFTHRWADFDFGLRATRAGFPVVLASGYMGRTDRNSEVGTFADPGLPRRDRIRHLFSVKSNPPREKARYLRRHGGPLWYVQFCAVYARYLLRIALGR